MVLAKLKYLLILPAWASYLICKAQNTLIFKSGALNIVRIEEVNEKSIFYYNLDTSLSIRNNVHTSDVDRIIFKSGRKIKSSSIDPSKNKKYSQHEVDSMLITKREADSSFLQRAKSIHSGISINLIDLCILKSGLQADIYFHKLKCALTIPYSINLFPYGQPLDILDGRGKLIYAYGLGIKYINNYYKSHYFYFLPMLEQGKVSFKTQTFNFIWSNYNKSYYIDEEYRITRQKLFIYSITAGNTWLFRNNLFLQVYLGGGLRIEHTGYDKQSFEGFSELAKLRTDAGNFTFYPKLGPNYFGVLKTGFSLGIWF